jgi:hypothetical protein
MDQDTRDLIAALATRAGMLMEDVVDDALALGSANDWTKRLQKLKLASDRIGKLIDAALALDR